MEIYWLREALFAGQTSNAFKLGTVLTLGWFWSRIASCSILYRGGSIETIDFTNILAVAKADASQIQPPNYLQHSSKSTYFYVIRRANNCGAQEYTLAASVKLSLDANGDMAKPRPNSILAARAEQVGGNKIQLLWFYCPIEQKSRPESLKLYYDSGTGQIDYSNAIVSTSYAGRLFYSYVSNMLDKDTYLFAIKVEDAAGTEDASSAKIQFQFGTGSSDTIDIVGAEAV
ncbi:MAG: hypothetical protein JSV99_02730 [Planctomycetota bacterium]|nr:MAG: hypothetical protein JSV99_02730 [Planctomycetota bacterium]